MVQVCRDTALVWILDVIDAISGLKFRYKSVIDYDSRWEGDKFVVIKKSSGQENTRIDAEKLGETFRSLRQTAFLTRRIEMEVSRLQ